MRMMQPCGLRSRPAERSWACRRTKLCTGRSTRKNTRDGSSLRHSFPIVVNYVIFEKAAIPATSRLWNDHVAFYNYAAGMLMERLLLTARDWTGGPRRLVAKFGHVRGIDHADTLAYFAVKQVNDPRWMPWHLLSSPVQFVDSGAYLGMQAADQYAGMLGAAMNPDELGGYEQHHLLAISHQIRRCEGRAWGYGFKVMGQPGCMEGYPWWRSAGI